MNRTTKQNKNEHYETPEILEIAPVSVAVQGTSPNPDTIGDPENPTEGGMGGD